MWTEYEQRRWRCSFFPSFWSWFFSAFNFSWQIVDYFLAAPFFLIADRLGPFLVLALVLVR
jgi:hypothetical protein